MLEHFFEAAFTITRLHMGPSGPYIDGFAHELEIKQYGFETARRYLRAAAHLGQYVEINEVGLNGVDGKVLKAFDDHLSSCNCPQSNRGTADDVLHGAKRYLKYLRSSGRLDIADFEKQKPPEPELVTAFKHWLKQDKVLSESTLRNYGPGAIALVEALGPNPGKYDAQSLRHFLL